MGKIVRGDAIGIAWMMYKYMAALTAEDFWQIFLAVCE